MPRSLRLARTALSRSRFGNARAKTALDKSTARGEIAIARRQLPDRMQMIGQHDESIDHEGMGLPRYGDRFAQGCDMIDQQGFPP